MKYNCDLYSDMFTVKLSDLSLNLCYEFKKILLRLGITTLDFNGNIVYKLNRSYGPNILPHTAC